MTTDPQTAADAAERVQAFLDARASAAVSDVIATVIPDAGRRSERFPLTASDLAELLADRARMAAELEQARGELARARDDSSEAWLGKRIEALRKVLRDKHDTIRAARIEANGLRQELDAATEIVADIGEALNPTELYIALGDLAQLFAPRTAALVERERAETTAARPTGGTMDPADRQWWNGETRTKDEDRDAEREARQ